MTDVSFTAHNICLNDGSQTKPEIGVTMAQQPIFCAAKRLIRLVFPRRVKTIKSALRPLARQFSQSVTLADLGCLAGEFSVEFAHIKSRINLSNLKFVRDDAWNIGRYGPVDIIFCAGLFYHVDKPKEFLITHEPQPI